MPGAECMPAWHACMRQVNWLDAWTGVWSDLLHPQHSMCTKHVLATRNER